MEFLRVENLCKTYGKGEATVNNKLSDEQITGNIPLLSIQGQIEGKWV